MIKEIEPIAISGTGQQDFALLVELQQAHSETTLKLEQVETQMSVSALKAATNSAPDYVVLQERLARLDEGIKSLFAKHPEWRDGAKKSVKTPYGSVEQRTVTELEVANPAATVALIEQRAKSDSKFDAGAFLRIEKEPNLEALEALSDEELAMLGVSRVKSERVTVKPAKVSAKAVTKAAAAAAKA
jgi:hypothetical protein